MVVRVHGGIINDQMLAGSLRYFDIADSGGLGTNVIGPSANQRAAYAEIGAGGTGYTLGDVLTLAGTTAGTAATFTVSVIDGVGTGPVLSVSLTTSGNMTTVDSNPVATTGGTGTGATLNVTYTSLVIIPGATDATPDGSEFYVGVGKPITGSAADKALSEVAKYATIVEIAIVDANTIRIAVENEGFGWDRPGGGDAEADMQTAIVALSTVTVPDTTANGVTFDFAGATVTERTFASFT